MTTTKKARMGNPASLAPGQEQFENFTPAIRRAKPRVQYDYRDHDGELFSCIAPSLAMARQKRALWAAARSIQN